MKKLEPIDIVSLAVLTSFTILKLKGVNHIVDQLALAIIAFYYGYRLTKNHFEKIK